MRTLVIILSLIALCSQAQTLLPIHSFYKDQLFSNKLDQPYNGGDFFPVSANEYDLIPAINDSSKQYYDLTEILFKKFLFELKGEDYSLNITPLVNFSMGKDLADTSNPELFQNTRGFYVEGTLLKNFSFSTSFYENQGRFASYQRIYYKNAGELYPQADSSYQQQNAVIPGAGRTKDFKGDGFDYAFALGSLCYQPTDFLSISAGNNHQFIGEGHRSILLSDNSVPVPYFRIDYKIGKRFSFSYMRARMINLLRRPFTSSAEAYYESKGYSVNYLTYKPTDWINLSLFDGGLWNRGDSLIGKNAHPLLFNPVPLVSSVILKGKGEVFSLMGLNAGIQIGKNHRFYGQLAVSDLDFSRAAAQIGYRGYRFFGLSDFMIQMEVNAVPVGFYEAANPRLNYVNYNLSIAHIKGQGFVEYMLRSTYEWKRLYLMQSVSLYDLKDYDPLSLLPVYSDNTSTNYSIFYSNTEIGYRFNRKINLCLFASFIVRTQSNYSDSSTQMLQFGLRTSLINNYTDF